MQFVSNILQACRQFFFSKRWTFNSSSFFTKRVDPSTVYSHSLPVSQSKTQPFIPPSSAEWSFSISCRLVSSSWDVVASLGLGTLFHCCILGHCVVSSRPSAFYDWPIRSEGKQGSWVSPHLLRSSPLRPHHYRLPASSLQTSFLLDLPHLFYAGLQLGIHIFSQVARLFSWSSSSLFLLDYILAAYGQQTFSNLFRHHHSKGIEQSDTFSTITCSIQPIYQSQFWRQLARNGLWL